MTIWTGSRPANSSHTDYSIVMEDIMKFYREDGCRELRVDLGNAGEPLVEQYQAMGVVAKGILFILTIRTR